MFSFSSWIEISFIDILGLILLKPEDYVLIMKLLGKGLRESKLFIYKIESYLMAFSDDDHKQK